MLTPQEISGKEFVKAVFGGYDMSAVDDFLETLTGDYSALYKENAILKSKIKVLVEKVEEYRSTDDAMRMALLTAQRMSEEITSEAKKKSEEMLAQAEKKSKEMLDRTETDVRDRQSQMTTKFSEEQERLAQIKTETIRYIRASQEILRQHGQFLMKLEEVSNEIDVPVASEDSEPAVEAEELMADEMAGDDEPLQPDDADEAVETTNETAEEVVLDDMDEEAEFDEDTDVTPSIVVSDDDPFAEFLKDDEAPKKQKAKASTEQKSKGDEPTSPRPKFDFNNLKFGSNYTGE